MGEKKKWLKKCAHKKKTPMFFINKNMGAKKKTMGARWANPKKSTSEKKKRDEKKNKNPFHRSIVI